MPLMAHVARRYVAHFDMLGMSALTLRDPKLAFSVLSRLADARDEILGLQIEITTTGEIIRDRLARLTFSDTIVAVTTADQPADLRAIVLLCTEFFTRSLSYAIPLRGGIAHGEMLFSADGSLFVGPPLVEAPSPWRERAMARHRGRRRREPENPGTSHRI